MEIELTTMSSKGQVVIPIEMREDIPQGEPLVLIKNKGQIIMKKSSELNKNFKDDLAFAKRTEEALKRYEKGGFKEMSFKEFSAELDKW